MAQTDRAPIRAARLLFLALPALLVTANAPAANRDQLRVIVQEQCLPHWKTTHAAAPCEALTLPAEAGEAQGYALLHDITGGAHYLLIPTRTVSGIESPDVLAPAAPNYFEAAWEARGALAADAGRAVPDASVGLAVNRRDGRTQDQLHVHISCQKPATHEALMHLVEKTGPEWTPIVLSTGPYMALRVMGNSLAAANPFRMLAEKLPGARADMGRYSLLVAGISYQGEPGFLLIAGENVPGSPALIDPSCAILKN